MIDYGKKDVEFKHQVSVQQPVIDENSFFRAYEAALDEELGSENKTVNKGNVHYVTDQFQVIFNKNSAPDEYCPDALLTEGVTIDIFTDDKTIIDCLIARLEAVKHMQPIVRSGSGKIQKATLASPYDSVDYSLD